MAERVEAGIGGFYSWLCDSVTVGTAQSYTCVVRKWFTNLNGNEPSPETAQDYLYLLHFQGEKRQRLSFIRSALIKFLLWQSLEHPEGERMIRSFSFWLKDKVRPFQYDHLIREIKAWLQQLDGRPTTQAGIEYLEKLGFDSNVSYPQWRAAASAIQKFLSYSGVDTDELRKQKRQYHKNHLQENVMKVHVGEKSFCLGGRRRPRTDRCELCNKEEYILNYHHWDDSNPARGLWLCHRCHMFAEGVDSGLSKSEYLEIKKAIDLEFGEPNEK